MVEVLKTRRFVTQRKEKIGTEHLLLGRTEEGSYIIIWERDVFRHVNGFTHLMSVIHASSQRELMISRFEDAVFDHTKKTIRHFK